MSNTPDTTNTDPPEPSATPAPTPDPQRPGLEGPLGQSPLHPAEETLLNLLADPKVGMGAIAAKHGMSELQLAIWLQKPHIAEAYDALRQFRAQQRKLWQEEVSREAVEQLRDLMHNSEDPIEKRRSATAILRAFNRPARRARHTQAAAGAAPEPDPRQKAAEEARARAIAEANAKADAEADAKAKLDYYPLPKKVLEQIDNDDASDFPQFSHSLDRLTKRFAERLTLLENPTPRRLFLAVYYTCQGRQLGFASDRADWMKSLENSPFVTCRDGWKQTPGPIKRDGKHATRTYTFTHQDGRRKTATIHLEDARTNHADDGHWQVAQLDTS